VHATPFPLYPVLHVHVADVDGGAWSAHVAFGWHGLAAHASKFTQVKPFPEYPGLQVQLAVVDGAGRSTHSALVEHGFKPTSQALVSVIMSQIFNSKVKPLQCVPLPLNPVGHGPQVKPKSGAGRSVHVTPTKQELSSQPFCSVRS
jgi:hypothetical protein